MATGKGIPGIAVAMVGGGAYLVYAGVQDVPLLDGLRDLAKGQQPTGRKKPGGATWINELPTLSGAGASTGAAANFGAGSQRGDALVNAAKKYLGIRYGTPTQGRRMDCSWLLYLAFRDVGIKSPQTSVTFYSWSALRKVTDDQPGDVLWRPGHVAMSVGGNQLIEASTWGKPVAIRPIYPGFLRLRYIG